MRRFVKYLFIFFLPIVILFCSTEVLLRYIPNDYSYKKDYLDSNSNKIRILVLGSSHSYYGINPKYISLDCFNAGYISQSIDYDYYILKKYSDKWNNLKFIVLPIDYFSLFNRLETSIESWRIKNYTIYFHINTSINPVYYSEMLSNDFVTNKSRIINYYLEKHNNITCTNSGWGFSYSSENRKDLFETGIEAAKRHKAKSNEYFTKNENILKSIIAFAKQHGIVVLLFTSPAYKTYIQYLNDDQLKSTFSAINQMAHIYDNVKYFNFLTDSSFTAKDFYDADHLDEVGAKKLSLKIADLINKPLRGRQTLKSKVLAHE